MTSDVGLTIDEHEGLTLRERKRLAAQEALSSAAIRLAMEKGLENVRVEDIAAEVGVSPRTFNNYFSSKEEAICAITIRRNGRIADLLLSRPADEPIWTAVINAVSEHYADMTGDGAAVNSSPSSGCCWTATRCAANSSRRTARSNANSASRWRNEPGPTSNVISVRCCWLARSPARCGSACIAGSTTNPGPRWPTAFVRRSTN